MNEIRRTREEVQARQDAEIIFAREEERNSLIYIAVNRDELIAKYMLWVSAIDKQGVDNASLTRWEIDYFGAALYPAAHGILSHGVRIARGFVPHERK